MAKRHVVQYYLEKQNEYLEMMDNLKELQELALDGKVEEWEVEDAKQDVEKLAANYEAITYFMLLLNKPNKKDKEEDEIAKSWYDYLHEDALIDESKDCLKKFKELVKNAKERESK